LSTDEEGEKKGNMGDSGEPVTETPTPTSPLFWRLVGIIILGALTVVLLTPIWTLPFGKSSLVVQGPPGDAYTTHYASQRPIDYENLSKTIPYMEGWSRYNATQYISATDYLEPRAQALWIYQRQNTTTQVMLVWSNKIAELHIPSVCYTYQGYRVLSEKPVRVMALNTTKRSIHFYANELWTQNSERSETREVYYFFVKYGFGRGGREAYFVRIETINTPRDQAREINTEFASQIFLNIIDIYGLETTTQKGSTILEYITGQGPATALALAAILGAILLVFFWMPGKYYAKDQTDDRALEEEGKAENPELHEAVGQYDQDDAPGAEKKKAQEEPQEQGEDEIQG